MLLSVVRERESEFKGDVCRPTNKLPSRVQAFSMFMYVQRKGKSTYLKLVCMCRESLVERECFSSSSLCRLLDVRECRSTLQVVLLPLHDLSSLDGSLLV
eukprot:TRINITY_DN4086_c0_g1_i1.p1 TRINITY_DN4086_c0_g1~~TRINITY_DN4086_c0_g1_i1.p1  ORF type:complete len:100 (-),score=6.58 TRINITY_DN4086_c0_g1_i1:16-315(-)